MIQLRVYPDSPKDSAQSLFLDLYETQPIKLTLSIEDITSAEATSVFSRTFKVPATAHNAEFFENAFAIQGVTYDITIKKPAEILVDGQEFRQGHIRLQKIYINGDEERIDYELLFLGETRDFSSAVGEDTMCQLTLTDFNWPELPVSYTNADDFTGFPDYVRVRESWEAYPSTVDANGNTITPNVGNGFADGDLLFPLIDHGNAYSGTNPNDPTELENGFYTISVGTSDSFTSSNKAISSGRLKPMFRAKRLLDQIFENAGYTYQSDFLESDLFKQMYISAFGNTETVGVGADDAILLVARYFEGGGNNNNDVDSYGYFSNQVIADPAGGYNINIPDTGSQSGGSYYVAQGSAAAGGAYFGIEGGARVDAKIENSDYGYTDIDVVAKLVIVNTIGGSIQHILATGNPSSGGGWSSFTYDSRNGGYQPQGGDIFQVIFEAQGSYDISEIGQAYWHIDAAPGVYYPLRDLDCEYQQIDYVKDLITMFRLVMQPDPKRPNNFIIEPWQEFIGSGDTFDWTDKLDHQKDVVAEPVFNTQSAVIEFTKAEEEDLINKFHQDNNKHPYGWLRFNSQNELLKGKRDIEVKGIAPTPVDQINHGGNNHPYPQWILPTIIEVTGENFQRLPIKPKSRFLFYNGLQEIEVAQDKWYMNSGSGGLQQSYWPLVSSYEHWPPQQVGLNLNFSNDTRYYIEPDPGAGYFNQGQTLFDNYWARYIDTLYNKFSRKVTANFILDSTDLQTLSFDDLIFVNGVYYRPEKINNAEVGNKTSVKCELITVLDAKPNWRDETLTGVTILGVAPPCSDGDGSISIQQDGTPILTAELNTGQTATFNAPAGQAPYNWSMPNVAPGTYEITLTDSLNRQWLQTVQVPVSTATPVSFSVTFTHPTDCEPGKCNGTMSVIPSGGTGPYTIVWQDSALAPDTFSRSGLCPGIYTFSVSDSNGCFIQGTKKLVCEEVPSEDNYIVQELDTNLTFTQIGNMPTNPDDQGGNKFHQAFLGNVGTQDYTNYPDYDWQEMKLSPWYRIQGTQDYVNKTNPTVFPGLPSSRPRFQWSASQSYLRIPQGYKGTVNWSYSLELTNIQGIDLTGVDLEVVIYKDGITSRLPVNMPTLPIDGTPVRHSVGYGAPLTGNESTETRAWLQIDPLNTGSFPNGPIIGYRGWNPGTPFPDAALRWSEADCTLLPTEYPIKSLTALNTGDVIGLDVLEGCYEVTDTTSDTEVANFTQIFDDCIDCRDNQPVPFNSWKLELFDALCGETGTFVYGNAGPTAIAAGEFVNIAGSTDCYRVIEQSPNQPTVLIPSSRFADCAECQSAVGGYNYIIELCEQPQLNQVTASVSGLIPGRVYKMLDGINAGKCVEIISQSGSGGDNIDTSTIYKDCVVCEGGPSASKFASNRSENQGTFGPICNVDTIFDIYSDIPAPAPDLLIPGDRMFSDPLLTQPWDGGNLYYGLATFSGSNNSTACIRIDSQGYVQDNIVC